MSSAICGDPGTQEVKGFVLGGVLLYCLGPNSKAQAHRVPPESHYFHFLLKQLPPQTTTP